MKHSIEPNLYGYSTWLAKHLGYTRTPVSLRGFQHGWIWWRAEDMPYVPGCGLDPNTDEFFGALVQDRQVEDYVRSRGVYARACGLPFLSYYKHCGLSGIYSKNRRAEVLYVPTHSNSWNDWSERVTVTAERFNKAYGESSILLSYADMKIAGQLSDKFKRIELGAGVSDIQSFFRIMSIFESYQYVVTDSIGSHICYALACGAKVGIIEDLFYYPQDIPISTASDDDIRAKSAKFAKNMRYISSLNYIEDILPGIVINGGLPNREGALDIPIERPDVIADLLGWNITYSAAKAKGRGTGALERL